MDLRVNRPEIFKIIDWSLIGILGSTLFWEVLHPFVEARYPEFAMDKKIFERLPALLDCANNSLEAVRNLNSYLAEVI
jgi:hypothetical protein